MRKFLQKFSSILLIFVAILLFIAAFSEWQDQRAFVTGEKKKRWQRLGWMKTYRFAENSYPVVAKDSSWKDGDEIPIFFLKSRPYMVAENPYVYHSDATIQSSLVGGLFFLLFAIGSIQLQRWRNRRT
ncbi:hypothetical protein IGI37_000189 [Enterococcus sp. AZ194]|uniref:hypothetical protein n=1 Tax=Enterococcus sp. AZ194 TaxID=2774629 RepID=UPI003F274E07